MLIHIARGQQTLGAFDVAELKKKINAGDILLDDLSWTEGDAEWSKLSSFIAAKAISLDTPSAPTPTVQIGKSVLSAGGVVTGVVAHSKHDRVGVVSGEGGGSYGCTMYEGTGRANASFSFQISTEIDVRHEFWLRQEDGLETQFVFPTHMPVANNQKVCLTSLCLSGRVVGIYVENLTSRKSYVFSVSKSGVLVEDDGSSAAYESITDDIFESAFSDQSEIYLAYPQLNAIVDEYPLRKWHLTFALSFACLVASLYVGYLTWKEGWAAAIFGALIVFGILMFVVLKLTGFTGHVMRLEDVRLSEQPKIVASACRELLGLRNA